MTGHTHYFARAARACAARFKRLKRNTRGNIAIMFGLMAPILIGGMGLAMESAYWYVDQRGMQNAADAAALAAATDGTSNYQTTVNAVAAQYGFANNVGGATVTSTNTATCPGTASNTCYQVSITSKQVLYLLPVVGFRGNTELNGSPAQTLLAAATAKVGTTPREYCILALNTSGTALQTNGSPTANLAGCDTMSDSSANCHGHNLAADYGDAHITDSGCGVVQTSNVPLVPDPYTALAANVPPNTCGAGNYPQEPSKPHDPPLPASNQWSGSKSLSGNVQVCGDLQLTGDVTINAPSTAVLVIENGQLDTNGYTIRTASGSQMTVVFSGDNSGSYTHSPTGGGTLDIQAPKSGPWSGVALYQDPSLTSGVDMSAAGNSPAWDITGLVYLSKANVTFSGIVNKSSNGDSCFAIVVGQMTINGTAAILEHGGCAAAGLNMPTNQIPGRGTLVF